MINFMREWFSVNRSIVLFVYGQTFFVLGLAIVIQSRKHSRLNLARSLPWLAGFGFLHGFNEWGDLFLPMQAQFLPQDVLKLLNSFHLILLAASFVSLIQLGIELLRPLPARCRWLRLLPWGMFAIWFIGPFWMGHITTPDTAQWTNTTNTLARYFLGLPGGLLAGYGLIKQISRQIHPLGLVKIEKTLYIASGALITYGLLGGLLVPTAPFFPANILNESTFTKTFIVPPSVFRSLAGLILTITMIRALEVFDLEAEQMILHMEEEQVIANERERMARDLHDGALQQIYAAGLFAQTLEKNAPAPQKEKLGHLVGIINQSIEQLRRFLAQGQVNVETVRVIPALEAIIEKKRHLTPIEMRWEMPNQPHLSPEKISHLMAFTNEALSNAIRHAKTDRIELNLKCVHHRLSIAIRDFGDGLPENPERGYGLRNMHDRARLLGATLQMISTPKKGTTVILDIPMENNI